MELGDLRPTQLLRRMQQLLGDSAATSGPLLRELFLQRIPPNVRIVFASSGDAKSLDELATLADKILDAAHTSMASIAPTSLPREVDDLRTEVARLKELVGSLSAGDRSTQYRSPSPRHQPRSRTPPPASSHSLCWYHARFGDRARKCTPPCSQSGNFQASR